MASEVPPHGFQSGDPSHSELAGEHRAHIHPSFNQSLKAHDRSSSPGSVCSHASLADSSEQQAWVNIESFSLEPDPPPTPTSTHPRYPLQANESSRSAKRSPLELTSSAIQPSSLPIPPSDGQLAQTTKHSSTQKPFNSTTHPSDLAEQPVNPGQLISEQSRTSGSPIATQSGSDEISGTPLKRPLLIVPLTYYQTLYPILDKL